MKRTIPVWLLLAASTVASQAAITLPASGVLAGPLDDARTSFGDAISNYPFGNGAAAVNLHGWVSIEFSPPAGRLSRFRVRWHTVAGVPRFAFANGHYIDMFGEQALSSSIQATQGDLNLDTGEITNLEVHAIFQNVLIQKSSRYNRLPLLSDAQGFSALFVDFPPIEYPFELPFSERPATSLSARFVVDASQRITGFELHGVSFIPITVLPSLGITAPFVFGRAGITIFPGMDGCLPGTTPPSQCLTETTVPDGIDGPLNAILSPHLNLVTAELREAGGPRSIPAALPGASMEGASVALGGRLYLTGGSDGEQALRRVSSYDPASRQWTTLPDMPRAVSQHCAAAAGGRIYVAGGRSSPGGGPLASVSAYDPVARVWSPVADLPVASADGACVSLDARVYFFGGATAAASATDSGWAFDTATGQWTALPRMPVALSGSAVAVAGREIWVVNGTTDGRSATNRVLVFSPDSAAWREGPPTERAVYDASAAFFEGRLFLAGGRTAPGGALDVGRVLYHSQTMQLLAQGTWYPGLYPPIPASGMAGAVVGDTWYLAGGDTSSGPPPAPTPIVQAFSAALGWAASDSFPAFVAQTVRNAAGLGVGPLELAPGAVASILGTNLAGRTLEAPPTRVSGRYITTDLPEELDGVRVTVDGIAAGVLAVSPKRVDFQVPFDLPTGRAVAVRVSRDGVESPAALVPLEPAAPGIFTYTYGETRSIDALNEAAAIVTNADGTLNYPSQPARGGDTITVRVTGLGDVEPRPQPLQRGPRDPAVVVRPPEVLIDGRLAEVLSAVLVPGEAGLYDVRVAIPRESRTGVRVKVQLRAGAILSNPAVLVIE